MTASGEPDYRYKEAKEWKASHYGGSSASSSSGASTYTGRVTASGAPDMRTTAGKQWT